MTRHLQGIPTTTEQSNVTLRILANEGESEARLDDRLRKTLGNAAYYLCAENLYGLNDHDPLADPIVGAGGGVLATYDGLREVLVERRNKASRHLGAVSLEKRTLACFSVQDAHEDGVSDMQYDISLGMIMTSVGVELDEAITLETIGAANDGQLQSAGGEQPALRVVK